MNVSIIHHSKIKENILDELAKELPVIIARELEVPGGNVAPLKPDQVALSFLTGSSRDTGSDIKIMAFARSNFARRSTERDRAKHILEKIIQLINKHDERYTVTVRLYLMEVGAAEQTGA